VKEKYFDYFIQYDAAEVWADFLKHKEIFVENSDNFQLFVDFLANF
jgi:hypothetical protein